MKRISLGLLLALLFVAPTMVAMDNQPKEQPKVVFTESQKEEVLKALLASDMEAEAKQRISLKLMNGEALSEEDRALLEAYDLLPKEEETAFVFNDLLTRFIDMQAFGMGIAKCALSSKGIKKPQRKELLKVVIKALMIDDLEITIKDHEGTLGEFFDSKKLKSALTTIAEQHTEDSIDEDSILEYHILLKRSLKLEAFAKVLSGEDYGKLIVDRKVNIAYLLSLFGFIEEDFHDLDGLNAVINALLSNENVENHYILNCINFAVILKGIGYTQEELPDIDGLRSLISQAISWLTEDDGQTFNSFLSREGDHWRQTTKGQAPQDPQNSNI